ncbi:DUF4190 domain-containing protein [Kitasatospora sp. NPDC056783]|uniref:DUF4190 domain-containing protein n=1 Tax=Kitasatospora sp. NPDC056783 TaxID=3345943 RepID=UPI0036C0612A
MSTPESERPASGPQSPAATAAGADVGAGAEPAAVVATAPEAAPKAPAAGQDPRVDFRRDAVETEGLAEPERAAPVDPWAAPDLTAGPFATPPVATPFAAPAPQAVPPSAAPPQPPHPLPAGGWASAAPVTPAEPAARPGFPPGHPYGPVPAPGMPFAAPGPAPTSGLAVASLVTGLLLVAPVALVLGIVALVRINRRGERGSGLAVTGLVLGTIGTLLLALGLGAADFGSARDGRFGRPLKAPAGSVAWSDLKAGDCYDSPRGGTTEGGDGDAKVYWVHRLACADPHHGEVAGTAGLPSADGPYPGESEVRASAARLCHKVLGDYAFDQWVVPDGMDDVYLYPTAKNWASGDRYVTCAFEDREDRHQGTVRTDRSRLTAPQLAYLEAARGFNDAYLDQPAGEVSDAEAEYRVWARQVAAATRAEAAALSAPSAPWPAEVQPKIAKLVEAKSQAAAAWDAMASGGDVEGDFRRAGVLEAKTGPTVLEIRRGLSLSTGEQAPDLRV